MGVYLSTGGGGTREEPLPCDWDRLPSNSEFSLPSLAVQRMVDDQLLSADKFYRAKVGLFRRGEY